MLAEALSVLPVSIWTLYGWRRTRRVDWLTRVGPDGHQGRDLWINVAAATVWWRSRGLYSVATGLELIAEGRGR